MTPDEIRAAGEAVAREVRASHAYKDAEARVLSAAIEPVDWTALRDAVERLNVLRLAWLDALADL